MPASPQTLDVGVIQPKGGGTRSSRCEAYASLERPLASPCHHGAAAKANGLGLGRAFHSLGVLIERTDGRMMGVAACQTVAGRAAFPCLWAAVSRAVCRLSGWLANALAAASGRGMVWW